MEGLLCTFLGSLRAGSPCPQLQVLPPSSRTATTLSVPLQKPWLPEPHHTDTSSGFPGCFSSSWKLSSTWSCAADDSPSLLIELCDRKGLAVLPWGSVCHSQHSTHKP